MSKREKDKTFSIWVTYKAISRVIAVAVLAGAATVFLFSYFGTNQTSSWNLPLSGMTIAIDPGHGGPDGGAVSRTGAIEKSINLNIGLYLRDYLQEAGAVVMMTRDTDTDLADAQSRSRKTQDLHRRADLVKKASADMLISIHMNAIESTRWHGAQTFYDRGAGVESQALAHFIQEELIRNLENTDRVANTVEKIYLLRTAQIPAALVEVGFLSNELEAQLLATESYQRKSAAAIYQGILRFVSGEKLN